MNDAEDSFDSLLPTELDLNRLQIVDADQEGRVESENSAWVAIRYPVSVEKAKSWKWCAWSLIIIASSKHPPHASTYEFKTVKGMVAYLEQLEREERRSH